MGWVGSSLETPIKVSRMVFFWRESSAFVRESWSVRFDSRVKRREARSDDSTVEEEIPLVSGVSFSARKLDCESKDSASASVLISGRD